MKLVLDGAAVIQRSGQENAHRLALASQVSAPTIHRYIHRADEVISLDTQVLANILLKGMGLTPAQALELRLGDIFKFVE